MKNYLEHLKENPLKILWLAFIDLFCLTVIIYFIENKDYIIEDNSGVVYILFILFVIIVGGVANYQSYKEYKDGL